MTKHYIAARIWVEKRFEAARDEGQGALEYVGAVFVAAVVIAAVVAGFKNAKLGDFVGDAIKEIKNSVNGGGKK